MIGAAADAEHGPHEGTPAERLAAALEHARHLLPAQAPLQGFVHHNTLHAFEHLPFHEGVLEASRQFGAEPFEREAIFARHVTRGRIRSRDIDAVLDQDRVGTEPVFPGGPTRRALRKLRLGHYFEVPERVALRWWLEESDALRRVHAGVEAGARARLLEGASSERECLCELWDRLASAAAERCPVDLPRRLRPRDHLLVDTGVDTDEFVHPLLIRLTAAYLDQGLAYWTMPSRQASFLAAVRELYRRPFGPPDPWLRQLPARLTKQQREGWSAERTVLEMLAELGVEANDWPEVITRTLASLGGWAGMIQQMETRPEWMPVQVMPASLLDYLAVQLTLDATAFAHVSHGSEVEQNSWPPRDDRWRAHAYEAFVIAQLAGVSPRALAEPRHAHAWIDETLEFDALARRWTLQRAFERNYYVGVLDSMLAHVALGRPAPATPLAQLVFCIDEREEAFRRHLEERLPRIETLGYAGFFSLPIRFLGLDAIRPRQMCPVVITPRHLLVEEPVDPVLAEAHAARRRRFGRLQHASFIGGRTFVRGSLISLGLGLAAMIPLVARTLVPRTGRIGHHTEHKPQTRLKIERTASEPPDADGLLQGFTLDEMAKIVRDALETMGIATRLAPLVFIMAHGSHSLNNPHDAAHACGACSGGNGRPNARAFAEIANRPDIRALLSEQGLTIPDGTWFVGAYHDTCSDELEYYDIDRAPQELRASLAEVQRALHDAVAAAAHERARRFLSAPLDMSAEQARGHVEARAVDLAQPRPEFGHCTNAICFVGRRETTRGLYLDRRAFLVSWDPIQDPAGARLGPLLQAVGPVGAGINLEYLFSYTDNRVYGCGTKLPHNITSLIGIMDGHASDLRTGLPWQMVEIHEPVRLLTIIEAEPELLLEIVSERPAVLQLVAKEWITVVAWSPTTGKMSMFRDGGFEPYEAESNHLKIVGRSIDHYRGQRDHLPCVRVEASLAEEPTR